VALVSVTALTGQPGTDPHPSALFTLILLTIITTDTTTEESMLLVATKVILEVAVTAVVVVVAAVVVEELVEAVAQPRNKAAQPLAGQRKRERREDLLSQ